VNQRDFFEHEPLALFKVSGGKKLWGEVSLRSIEKKDV